MTQDKKEKKTTRPDNWPLWYDGKSISEPVFCLDYLSRHILGYTEGSFYTPEGRVTNLNDLHAQIFEMLNPYIDSGVSKKIENIVNVLKIMAKVAALPPQTDRIHLANGTLFLDGRFTEDKLEIVRSRLPVRYNPAAAQPTRWLRFLEELFHPEDIPVVQEFIGYCFIPSNAGQRMMIIKGSGGEGKSQIGHVLSRLFGNCAKDGSIGKIAENRFARADLENIHLMIDDDMRLDALKQTNYIKSIVTANGLMDLEKKGRQSYQGYLYARILAFSNGDLTSLYDRSDGFFRRQLVLTTRHRPADRVDDPNLSAKLCAEVEGILLWAFEGLQRLIGNDFRFTESERAKMNREMVKKGVNNLELFMASQGYIRLNPSGCITSRDLARMYQLWCDENTYIPMNGRTMIEALIADAPKYGVTYSHNVFNAAGRRVRGFRGLEAVIGSARAHNGWQRVETDDNPFTDAPTLLTQPA